MFYPSIAELGMLTLASAGVCLVGALLFWIWSLEYGHTPVWFTLAVGVIGLSLYVSVIVSMWSKAHREFDLATMIPIERTSAYNPPELGLSGGEEAAAATLNAEPTHTPPPRHFMIALCGFILAFPPLIYFTRVFIAALAAAPVDAIFYMTDRPLDRSMFREAERLALAGDIDAAVMKYRSYTDHRVEALLAAARLLVADGRYKESADLYREIRAGYEGFPQHWSEATFALAQLNEKQFDDPDTAMVLLSELVARQPEAEFGHLAWVNLKRLKGENTDILEDLDKSFESSDSPRERPRKSAPVAPEAKNPGGESVTI